MNINFTVYSVCLTVRLFDHPLNGLRHEFHQKEANHLMAAAGFMWAPAVRLSCLNRSRQKDVMTMLTAAILDEY